MNCCFLVSNIKWRNSVSLCHFYNKHLTGVTTELRFFRWLFWLNSSPLLYILDFCNTCQWNKNGLLALLPRKFSCMFTILLWIVWAFSTQKDGIAHKITQTCPYFICFWHQDKEFFFKLCCFEALKYDFFWVLQNICKLLKMWIRVFLVSRNDYKAVAHCDRWDTPLECFLLTQNGH